MNTCDVYVMFDMQVHICGAIFVQIGEGVVWRSSVQEVK